MRRLPRSMQILAALLLLLSGCRTIGAIGYYLAPRQIRPAEFDLSRDRVAVLIDFKHGENENPVFSKALHDKIVEYFHRYEVPSDVVAFDELMELRKFNPNFRNWSIQRVGRELDAEQVVHVLVEVFRLQEAPDHPVMTPYVSMQVKVIGSHELEPNIRLWPDEPEGRQVTCTRPPSEAVNAESVDAEARRFGVDAAFPVARLFFKWDAENMPKPER